MYHNSPVLCTNITKYGIRFQIGNYHFFLLDLILDIVKDHDYFVRNTDDSITTFEYAFASRRQRSFNIFGFSFTNGVYVICTVLYAAFCTDL